MTENSDDPRGVRGLDRLLWGILVRRGRGTKPIFPSSPTERGSGGLLTLTLRGKAMDGVEAQQERNRPQLSYRAWETGARTPVSHKRQQAGGAPAHGLRSVSSVHNQRNEQSLESISRKG